MDLSHSTDILYRLLLQGSANKDYEISFYNSGGQHQLEKQAEHEKSVLGPAAEGVSV